MEEIVQETLTKAVEKHVAGELEHARNLYASVLQLDPKQADANHNTGLIEINAGRVLESIPFLRIALDENSGNGQYWVSYIDALMRLEALDDAKNMLSQARQKGATGEAFNKLELRINLFSKVPTLPVTDKNGPEKCQSNILDTLKLAQALKIAKEKS